MIENHTKEETLSIKQHESCHPVTASSRSTTGLVKSRRSAVEKRSSVGDKPHSTRKENKDISNAKPLIDVSVPKDEKNEVDKQFKDKVEAGNKQRFVLNTRQLILYPFIGILHQGIYDCQLKVLKNSYFHTLFSTAKFDQISHFNY